MEGKKIRAVAEEAARLLFNNPDWTHRQAIKKAKEMILDEDPTTMDKTKKAN